MKQKWFLLFLILSLLTNLISFTSFAEENDPAGPFTLEVPRNFTAELKLDEDGIPYFELKLEVPQSVIDINNKLLDNSEYYDGYYCYEISIQFDYKFGNYDWNEGPSIYWNTSMYLDDFLDEGAYEYRPYGEEYLDGGINIEAEVYQFRCYFYSTWGYAGDWIDKEMRSDYSNIVTVGNPSYYKGASAWAEAELDRATEYGLITGRIWDNMSANITREEFAEVVVKLYEKYTGEEATYTDMSVFTDTTNPEVIKAYELGIVNGIGGGKFAPNNLINREQMAAMLYRFITVVEPGTDMSIEGAPVFEDEKDIAVYFIENVKFMSKHGFIVGSNNRFSPKGNSTREQAVILAVRVYEKFAGIN